MRCRLALKEDADHVDCMCHLAALLEKRKGGKGMDEARALVKRALAADADGEDEDKCAWLADNSARFLRKVFARKGKKRAMDAD